MKNKVDKGCAHTDPEQRALQTRSPLLLEPDARLPHEPSVSWLNALVSTPTMPNDAVLLPPNGQAGPSMSAAQARHVPCAVLYPKVLFEVRI